jgi:integrase
MTCKRGVQALGIGSKRLNPHALRHAGITILANHISERGIPVSEGMAVSRHKKADTFWKYVDRTGGRKREMVNAVASRAR